MNCDDFQSSAPRLLYGLVPETEGHALRGHLEHCEACRRGHESLVAQTCRELIDRLSDYIEGELSRDSSASIEAHLAVCEACVAYLSSFRRTIALSKEAFDGEEELPVQLEGELIRALLARQSRRGD